MVFKKGFSFVLDATFATPKAEQNLVRAFNKNYNVYIYYVYQDPLIAWDFTKKREAVEGRTVPKERFINAFFEARNNLQRLKSKFQNDLTVNILVKNFQNKIVDSIMDIDNIELILPIKYSKKDLEEKLHD
ncbi:hypothetical protein KIMC2_12670 [Xylocopilactobacillus apis]|uniref:UDP-N-acetylglucosamine kinase n=1 Tax=Xylocopilactobacillus apis TaxID=2932183 RepID=A0AAU9D331_9LACO|nr:hypothetical protein KIMC2_12670 [Xylocopilactobacillus apis]